MNPSSLVERWQLIQAINADPELSASAKTVAVALLGFVNSRSGECYPALEKIMAHSQVSKATAVRATKALESQGWVRIERDAGGDRESNRYYFAFNRIRGGSAQTTASGSGEAPGADEVHGIKIKPCDGIHGVKSEPSMASNFPIHGVKSEPELGEDNSFTRTQESLFGEGGLPEAPAFDFEAWFEQEWWPQYPLKVEKVAAKKAAKAIIEGRRSDGLQATPNELLAGVMRYAAAMTGKSPKYIKYPGGWLNSGRWTDEHADLGGRRAASEEVWRAGEEMMAPNKRAAG
jgi:hypothetical protein